jgi:exonuclease SbcD
MRFLHTSDWHLGRLFHQVSLLEDQAHALAALRVLLRDARPDALLLAGDVYDRAVPPPEAVELFDDFLHAVTSDLGLPIIVIAGNHDSPQRLGFGARLLARSGVHVAGKVRGEVTPIVLEDAHGRVHVLPLPYAEPAVVREVLARSDLHGHDATMGAQLEAARARVPAGERSVLVAHAFVAGGEASESERPLTVGGSGAVDVATMRGFSYVALGHLHGPQRVGAENIRYSGSLLPYSFSEAAHTKGVSLVTLDAAGACSVEHVALPPRRNLRLLRGTLAEVLAAGRADPRRDDYLHITLLDDVAVLDPMARLREVYPNALELDRTALHRAGPVAGASGDHRKITTSDLFASFFADVVGTPLDDPQRTYLTEVLEADAREEREA